MAVLVIPRSRVGDRVFKNWALRVRCDLPENIRDHQRLSFKSFLKTIKKKEKKKLFIGLFLFKAFCCTHFVFSVFSFYGS